MLLNQTKYHFIDWLEFLYFFFSIPLTPIMNSSGREGYLHSLACLFPMCVCLWDGGGSVPLGLPVAPSTGRAQGSRHYQGSRPGRKYTISLLISLIWDPIISNQRLENSYRPYQINLWKKELGFKKKNSIVFLIFIKITLDSYQ